MIVTRRDVSFEVEADPFWGQRTWEAVTYCWLETLLTPESDFIDVGAWIGPFTLWASQLAERVLAIEPDPVAYNALLKNIVRSNAWNVGTSCRALWDREGSRRLHSAPGGWGYSTSTLRLSDGKSDSILVEVERLETVAERDDFGTDCPLVIKMDTEGAEGAILSGSLDWLLATRPSLVVAPHDRLYPDQALREVVPVLAEAYEHAVDQRGEPLRWPDEPDPWLMIFTDVEIAEMASAR